MFGLSRPARRQDRWLSPIFLGCLLGIITATPGLGQDKPAASAAAAAFEKTSLTADELAWAVGLDVYKFQIDLPAKQTFTLTLREQVRADESARILHQYSFEKTDAEPMTMVVSFLRRDAHLGRFLLGDALVGHYRVQLTHATPSGIAAAVQLPLATIPSTHKTLLVSPSSQANAAAKVNPRVLLSILAHDPGQTPDAATTYPRAELLLEVPSAPPAP